MTTVHLVMATTDLQGMRETDMTDGISTLMLGHWNTVHIPTAHHPETTSQCGRSPECHKSGHQSSPLMPSPETVYLMLRFQKDKCQ